MSERSAFENANFRRKTVGKNIEKVVTTDQNLDKCCDIRSSVKCAIEKRVTSPSSAIILWSRELKGVGGTDEDVVSIF